MRENSFKAFCALFCIVDVYFLACSRVFNGLKIKKMDIDQIISEIFSRPALWDQKNKLYHNRVFVEKLWTSVAAEIKVPSK